MQFLCASFVRILTVLMCSLFLWSTGTHEAFANVSTVVEPALSQLKLPLYVWNQSSGGAPQGIVVALHGGCLHGRSYQSLGEALSRDGFMVVSLDLRGYGRWAHENFGSRRDRTFQYKDSMNDIERVVMVLRQSYPKTPVYVLGESLGANLAVHTVTKKRNLFNGLVVVSGYAGPKMFVHPKMLVHAVKIVTTPWRKLDITPYLKNKLATSAIATQEHFSDPLGRDRQSIRELCKTFRVLRAGRREIRGIDIPILVVHGTADRLCSVDAMVRAFGEIRSENKQLVLLHDAGHLLVETSKLNSQAVQAIGTWLKNRSSTPA